eukprot:GGOE01010260.1.p1 GENE.GGOE01010260.1~~GGOE01010260.1.p1  ORF type:complete len:1208 (-),score=403.92 GGOE01010260.1:1029-4382(-)
MEHGDGMEMLRSVFESMAVNSRITMDQLPFVLVGAEVQATSKEIDEAIEELFPDSDDADALLDFDHVLGIYQKLLHVTNVSHVEELPNIRVPTKPSLWRRFRDWARLRLQRRRMKQTAYERHMKPTMRLLLLILATSSVISIAVVVFAVVFIFIQSNSLVEDHVKRDGHLIADGLALFGYDHPVQSYNTKLTRLAALMGVVIEQLGHQSMKRTMKSSLQYQQLLLSNLLDGWYEHDYLTMVNASVMMVKGWVQQLASNNATVADIVNIVDDINPRMPDGQEILLARWNATTERIDFLTDFRFKFMCNGSCGADQTHGSTATRKALAGESGALFGYDYRPQPVIAGFTPLSSLHLALVYNMRQTVARATFMGPVADVVDTINAASAARATSNKTWRRENSQEIVLAHQISGPTTIITSLQSCSAVCLTAANLESSPVASAVLGLNGTNETTDFSGEDIICAYGPMERSGIGMEVKITQEEFKDDLYVSLGSSLDFLNQQLASSGSLVVEFASRARENATSAFDGLQFHTTWPAASECGDACGTFPNSLAYLRTALDDQETGVADGVDYRGQAVTAGVCSLPLLDAVLSIELATSQIVKDATAMAATITTYENDVRYAGQSTEVSMGRKKVGVAVARTSQDYNRLTLLKHRWDCPNLTCSGGATLMLAAVNGNTGFTRCPDYRNVDVMGAYTYLSRLDIGLVVKIDAAEAEERSFQLTAVLSGCSVAAVTASMLALALLANVLLKSMDRAWEEGKRAIEQEKQAFRTVIEAMYPAQVAKRMLAGEDHIVYHVPHATVFLSDIYEFTTTSNSISPSELIRFLGYTFGVMDTVAEFHHVHKVKTIGDAFLAVTGLPGMDSLTDCAALDMLLFASCCNQIFSNRFLLPEEAGILDTVVQTVLAKRQASRTESNAREEVPRLAQIPQRPSRFIDGSSLPPQEEPPKPDGIVDECGVPPVHCIMRYGLATGPITAGVLQGKAPLFDIWGKTVNLASRMESTGQAGRIQVAEGVFQAVVAQKDQPFLFDPRHKVYCKGFGHVNAHFVGASTDAPPSALLAALNVEPNLGQFFFDNPVPGFKPRMKGTALTSGTGGSSQRSSSTGQQSAHSSTVSGNNIRAEASLV